MFKGRPKVSTIAAAGKAASLPFERFGEQADPAHRDEHWPIGAVGGVAPPMGFDRFNEANDHGFEPVEEATPGGVRHLLQQRRDGHQDPSAVGLARAYRPKQRTSLPSAEGATPTVPAGWKADPTGRHQFRYWDGFHWTENVADAGEQSRDAVAS